MIIPTPSQGLYCGNVYIETIVFDNEQTMAIVGKIYRVWYIEVKIIPA